MIRASSALAIAAAVAVPFAQARVDEALGTFRAKDEVLYLWQGGQVKKLVPGFEHLAADVYWLRTVQYYGGERVFSSEKRYALLYPLIEITTTLDPRMEIAYRYGAAFLAEPQPVGAGRPDLGLAVLERGVGNNPGSWRLYQELGFFHFVYLKDAKRAAEILVAASDIPGAGYWLKNLAAELLGKGGEEEIALRMWREMYAQSEPGAIKENALVHVKVLEAAMAASRLRQAVARFVERTGRPPGNLGELAAMGLTKGPFVDPDGFPFVYDAGTGRVNVSRQSSLYREELMGEIR